MPGGLSASVRDNLQRRANGADDAPVAVAVSGGGDSLALLLIAHRWASVAGRPLLALTVDHGLNPASADWCAFVAERAARLGVAHRTLRWAGDKPAAGLPAAARAARHALLADAAREAGAAVILMGHTADDVAEAAAMRAAGALVATPREWAPSPAWPQGRGVFLLRPLLGVRRADLRTWLAERGETWIDDPANDDPRFARSRARRTLSGAAPTAATQSRQLSCSALASVREGRAGEFTLPRQLAADGRLLSALLLCAAGGATPPRGRRLAALQARLAGASDVTSTLAGARIEARGERLLICREAGEFARRDQGVGFVNMATAGRSGPRPPRGEGAGDGGASSAPVVRAPAGMRPVRTPTPDPSPQGGGEAEEPLGEVVFDGRLLIEGAPAADVQPLAGLAARLSATEQAALKAIPAAARGALPAIVSPSGAVSCPMLGQEGSARAVPLGLARLHAALGAVESEAAIWRVAKSQPRP
ncbi:MAG TPA: tRNA lysidine(34) synthetase TilS [Caulobacteraceae bacterium]